MALMLSNHEIVTIAVYLLGGATHGIDTEDIAVKANELCPGKFTWRKYPNQINIDTVRKRLWDAKKPGKGKYLIGSERDGWQLTTSGLTFAKKNMRHLKKATTATRLGTREKAWRRAEKNRLLKTEAFAKYLRGEGREITLSEAQGFFRIDDYSKPPEKERKLTRLLTTFRNDPDIGDAVSALAELAKGTK